MPSIALLAGALAGLAVGFIFPELAPVIVNGFNAYTELMMYEETKSALEDKVIPMNIQFGEELWAIEQKNLARQETYWADVWGAEGDLMYTSCENKEARATIGNRYEFALHRDALLKSTNMYATGLRSEIINRSIGRDLHSSAQMAVSAKWHEDNHVLDAMSKYYDLVSTMMKEVPYGNLPAYLGRVGDAYEGLMVMHSTSFNNSVASLAWHYDKMVNNDKAMTSVTKETQRKQETIIDSDRGQDYNDTIIYNTAFDNVYSDPNEDIKRFVAETGERG